MLETTARQWHFWRTDYRCQRPAVTCSGCGHHYQPHQSAGVMTFIGNNLVSCGNCEPKEKSKPKPASRVFPIPNKVVGRDVACRYIIRYDGRTFWHQTDVDVAEVYLKNKHDEVIAKIGSFDKFPKPIDTSDFDDIPY